MRNQHVVAEVFSVSMGVNDKVTVFSLLFIVIVLLRTLKSSPSIALPPIDVIDIVAVESPPPVRSILIDCVPES